MTIDTTVIVQVCGIITSVAAASAILYKVFKSLVVKTVSTEIESKLAAIETTVNKKLEDINNIITEHTSDSSIRMTDMSNATMRLARDRINQAYDYYNEIGMITNHQLYILEELYESYSALGGNHFTESQMDEIRGLRRIASEEYVRMLKQTKEDIEKSERAHNRNKNRSSSSGNKRRNTSSSDEEYEEED